MRDGVLSMKAALYRSEFSSACGSCRREVLALMELYRRNNDAMTTTV